MTENKEIQIEKEEIDLSSLKTNEEDKFIVSNDKPIQQTSNSDVAWVAQPRFIVEGKSIGEAVSQSPIPVPKPKRIYPHKTNTKRFFMPKEWINFINIIENNPHKFWFELLLHTGCRINEARNIKLNDVDLDKELIFLYKTKGGAKKHRTIQISTYLKNKILNYSKARNLGKIDYLMKRNNAEKCPSTAFMDKQIKKYCKSSGIKDYNDFSCHNIRKTTENWMVALNFNTMSITAHLGHNIDVAQTFYVATNILTSEDKVLIKSILDNLLQK